MKAKGEGGGRGQDGWMASPTQRTRVEQTRGDSGGQRSLVCFSPWGHKELDMTEQQRKSDNKARGRGSPGGPGTDQGSQSFGPLNGRGADGTEVLQDPAERPRQPLSGELTMIMGS